MLSFAFTLTAPVPKSVVVKRIVAGPLGQQPDAPHRAAVGRRGIGPRLPEERAVIAVVYQPRLLGRVLPGKTGVSAAIAEGVRKPFVQHFDVFGAGETAEGEGGHAIPCRVA